MSNPVEKTFPDQATAGVPVDRITIRPATLADVPRIKEILDTYATEGLLLSKTLSELFEVVRDFLVCVDGDRVIGAGGIHIIWEDLAELRSFAVDRNYRKRGIGRKLGSSLLDEARRLGVGRVFALTYATDFFRSLGFKVIDKTLLPRKIWADCIHCHKYPMCDEVAMIHDFRPYPEGPVGPPPELPQVIDLESLVSVRRRKPDP